MHFSARTSLLMTLLALSFEECTLLGAAGRVHSAPSTYAQNLLKNSVLSDALKNISREEEVRPVPQDIEDLILQYSKPNEIESTTHRQVPNNIRTNLIPQFPLSCVSRNPESQDLSIVEPFGLQPLVQIKAAEHSNTSIPKNYSAVVNEHYCAVVARHNEPETGYSFDFICILDRKSGACLYQLPINLSFCATSSAEFNKLILIALSNNGEWVACYDNFLQKIILWDLRSKTVRMSTTRLPHPSESKPATISLLNDGSLILSTTDLRTQTNVLYSWKSDQNEAQLIQPNGTEEKTILQKFIQFHLKLGKLIQKDPRTMNNKFGNLLKRCAQYPVLKNFIEHHYAQFKEAQKHQSVWLNQDPQSPEQLILSSQLSSQDLWINNHLLEINRILNPNTPKPSVDWIEKFIASAPERIRPHLLHKSNIDQEAYFKKYPQSVAQWKIKSCFLTREQRDRGAHFVTLLGLLLPIAITGIVIKYNPRLSQFLKQFLEKQTIMASFLATVLSVGSGLKVCTLFFEISKPRPIVFKNIQRSAVAA